MAGLPLETLMNQFSTTWAVITLGLFFRQVYQLWQDVREFLEEIVWNGVEGSESFDTAKGVESTIQRHLVSILQILGYRRKPFVALHHDLITPRVSQATCRWTEGVMDEFGTKVRDAPNAALFVHGMIVLAAFVVLEVVSLGVITTVGYATYFTTGIAISLEHYYEFVVAVLLLLTFSCLFTAQEELSSSNSHC